MSDSPKRPIRTNLRQLTLLYLLRGHAIERWQDFLSMYGGLDLCRRRPIRRFDRLLATQSTVPRERLYHLWVRRVEPHGYAVPVGPDYERLTSEPVAHREALTIKSKFQPDRQARILLVELGQDPNAAVGGPRVPRV